MMTYKLMQNLEDAKKQKPFTKILGLRIILQIVILHNLTARFKYRFVLSIWQLHFPQTNDHIFLHPPYRLQITSQTDTQQYVSKGASNSFDYEIYFI